MNQRTTQSLSLDRRGAINKINAFFIGLGAYAAMMLPCFASNPAQAVATGWVLPVIMWVIIIMAAAVFVKSVMSKNIGGIITGLLIALVGIFFAGRPQSLITLANAMGSAFGL